MKKLTSVLVMVSIFAVSALVTGCSSAKKEEVASAAPSVADTAKPAVESPVDLGASSAGRGL